MGRAVAAVTGRGPIAPALITITLLYVILDSLFPLWDAQKQTIHDKAAGTVVVKLSRA